MEEVEIILEVENTSEQTIDILQEEVKEIHPIYEQLDITPSIQKQEYKGSFDKVTVQAMEDIQPHINTLNEQLDSQAMVLSFIKMILAEKGYISPMGGDK